MDTNWVLYTAVLMSFMSWVVYLTHRQNMARIAAGLPPEEPRRRRSETWRLRAGLLSGLLLLALGLMTVLSVNSSVATSLAPPARFMLQLLGSYLLGGGAVLAVLFGIWSSRTGGQPGGSQPEATDDR